jgi:hypothetical protein
MFLTNYYNIGSFTCAYHYLLSVLAITTMPITTMRIILRLFYVLAAITVIVSSSSVDPAHHNPAAGPSSGPGQGQVELQVDALRHAYQDLGNRVQYAVRCQIDAHEQLRQLDQAAIMFLSGMVEVRLLRSIVCGFELKLSGNKVEVKVKMV